MILINAPTASPTPIAPITPHFVKINPLNSICSGSNQLTNNTDARPAKIIDPQLPIFKAFCTVAVLIPALSLIRTNTVPMMENMIPAAAINIGRIIGENPLSASVPFTIVVCCPNTIVANTVAT